MSAVLVLAADYISQGLAFHLGLFLKGYADCPSRCEPRLCTKDVSYVVYSDSFSTQSKVGCRGTLDQWSRSHSSWSVAPVVACMVTELGSEDAVFGRVNAKASPPLL